MKTGVVSGVPQDGKAALPVAAALLLVLLLAALRAAPALARDDIIPTRPGVTVDIQVEVPQGAPALLLLFEGAQGRLSPGYQGFAHKVFELFPRHGIGAALIGTPSRDVGFRGGLDPRFRESPAHIDDIDAVVKSLKRDYHLPVWILGVSNGTRSAAAYAMQRSKRISGVVLVSSSTAPPYGRPIHDLPGINAIGVPLLALAHRDDACQGSPPSGAAKIAEAATASPYAVAMIFSGGLDSGPMPCGVETHHTFFGLEEQVTSAIAWVIAAQAAGDPRLSTVEAK